MPLFECGGSTLLQNKNISIIALPNNAQTVVAQAANDGYDGYEQVTVTTPRFTNGETKVVTDNGTYSTIDANNKAYSNIQVDFSIDTWMATPIWSGESLWPANTYGESTFNPNNIDFSQYKYVVVYFKGQWGNGQWPETNKEGNVFLKLNDSNVVLSGWEYKRWDPNGDGHDSNGYVKRTGCGSFKLTSAGIYCKWSYLGAQDVSEARPRALRIYGLN